MITDNRQAQELAARLIELLQEYKPAGEDDGLKMLKERFIIAAGVASKFAIGYITADLEYHGCVEYKEGVPIIAGFDSLAQALSEDFKSHLISDYKDFIKFRQKLRQKDAH